MLMTKQATLVDESPSRLLASIPLDTQFWRFKSARGPRPVLALNPAIDLAQLFRDHYKALVEGFDQVLQQFSVRAFLHEQKEELEYIKHPVIPEEVARPFFAHVQKEPKKKPVEKQGRTGKIYSLVLGNILPPPTPSQSC